jgi:hypothetical protein
MYVLGEYMLTYVYLHTHTQSKGVLVEATHTHTQSKGVLVEATHTCTYVRILIHICV